VPPPFSVVAHVHAFSTDAAQQASLQQSRALSGGTELTPVSKSPRILGQPLLIALKLLPADIARVYIRDQILPFLPR